MNRADVDQLLAAARDKRDRAIAVAESEYKRAADAIRVVKGLIPDTVLTQAVDDVTTSSSGDGTIVDHDEVLGVHRGMQMHVVKEAIKHIAGNFTVNDVERVVQEISPGFTPHRIALSKCLIRLMENDVLQQLAKGAGQRPSVYVKKNADESHIRPEVNAA